MKDSFLFRCCLVAVVGMGVTAPLLLHAMFQGAREMRNAPILSLPITSTHRSISLRVGRDATTTVICGVGLMVYAFRDFVPTRRFAFMMARYSLRLV